MTRPLAGIVVSHTHWDREWYLPYQRFRMRLVELIDGLLDVLDREPSYRYFTLDGQTVVLEDYLEVRPENHERLARYIREGRIMIGPWYVLPDEFLVSGESLVRNLMLGHLVGERFGGVMPVGYLPDTFGHPAQIPQIFQGFGIDNAIIYRGVQTDRSEFLWQAPDGTAVLTVFLPGGYCNAMQLTAAPWRFLERLDEIVESIKSVATTDTILLMNGCDHLPPRAELEQMIAQANRRLNGDLQLRQGTLVQYLDRVREARPELKTVRGEFRRPRPGRVTPGVVSTRMYLKLENFRAFTTLEKLAEPLSALSWVLGEIYPRAFLWQAWKYLLQNHPHDSICGCSIDAVHQDMMSRFRWTQEIAADLIRRGLEALASRVDTSKTGDNAAFLVFNSLPRPREDYFVQHIDFFRPGQEFQIKDHRGEVLPHQVIARRPTTMYYDPFKQRIELEGKQKPSTMATPKSEMAAIVDEGVWRQWQGEEVDVLILPGQLPAFGYATHSVENAPGAPRATDLKVDGLQIENGLLRVKANPDGTLDVFDKRTGSLYSRLNLIEDRGDRGDEYTYCPPSRDVVTSIADFSPEIRLAEAGPVRATLEIKVVVFLPKGLSEDRAARTEERVGCPVTMRVSLAARSPKVEVRLDLENLAEDNILRVIFPTPIQTVWSHAHGQFQVVQRPVRLAQDELERVPGPDEEVAVNTYPHHVFVDVSDGERGLAILSRGLTEYEVIPGDAGVSLALTLLRSVGWLSRADLETRFGNAGPSLATPEAQCLGRFTFEYAILPHAGNWSEARVQQEAEGYVAPPVCGSIHQNGQNGGTLPPERGFVEVEPHDLVMSALKKAEKEEALILRLFNPTDREIEVSIRLSETFASVRRVNLLEQELPGEPLLLRDGHAVSLPVRGNQICTLKFAKG